MFQLTRKEFNALKSQIVTLGRSPRATPYAFTAHGVAMLSAVLNSRRAVQVSILKATMKQANEFLTKVESLVSAIVGGKGLEPLTFAV